MSKNAFTKSATALGLAGLLTVTSPGASATSAGNSDDDSYMVQTTSEEIMLAQNDVAGNAHVEQKQEAMRYLDVSSRPLSVTLGLAAAASQKGGIIVVSYGDDAHTRAYYNVAKYFHDEGAPVVAVLRGPADGNNGFDIYYDGKSYGVDKYLKDHKDDPKIARIKREKILTVLLNSRIKEIGEEKHSDIHGLLEEMGEEESKRLASVGGDTGEGGGGAAAAGDDDVHVNVGFSPA